MTTRRARQVLGGALSVCALVTGLALASSSVATAASRASDRVILTLTGEIPVKCEFTAGASLSLAFATDVRAGASRSASFGVDCNVPYEVRARSLNGALVTGATRVGPGMAAAIPYDLSVEIPTTTGAPVRIDQCASAALKADGRSGCARAHSGKGVSLAQASELTVTLNPDAGRMLVRGDYADVITMEIRPQV